MGLHRSYDDAQSFIDCHDDDGDTLPHRKHIRQLLEKRLEQKRLKEELEFFDGELDADFDWDYVDK